MELNQFDFVLPQELIALRPVRPRHSSRLLVVGEKHEDKKFEEIDKFLKPQDALVFNDTRVIPAQLNGVRIGRGEEVNISATLHKKIDDQQWVAFLKGAKKIKKNDIIRFGDVEAEAISEPEDGEVKLKFNTKNDFSKILKNIGEMPLPPYIASKRQVDEKDDSDYQTIYAKNEGAVAAPTAGLHFTKDIFNKLNNIGIKQYFLTLHVGAGTFLPVKHDDITKHKMHSEFGMLDEKTAKELNEVKKRGGRIIAVGTTSLRLLESATDEKGQVQPFYGDTDIFITPSYKFKVVDGLITNFHLPKSTLFMLVCAFAGTEKMKKAYEYAIKAKYRFYSYGDSSLLFKQAR